MPYLGNPASEAKPEGSSDSLYYTADVIGVASSGQYAPFLLQTNRNGNIAASPFSGNLSAGIYKPATAPTRWFDYDFGVQLTGRIAGGNNLVQGTGYFNQLYAHARLAFVDITAGIKPYHMGPQDDELSSGGLLFSPNAHPLPRITIGIDDYVAFPGLFGYLEVKGGLTHGWFTDNEYVQNSYLHHAYAGARVGGKLPVRLAYEFHHVAQWGGTSPVYGDLGNDWHSFMNAVFAGSGGSMANDQLNAQGNHIGSQIISIEINPEKWQAIFYWQSMFEDGPIKFPTHATNRKDGLWGLHISLKKWPFINGFTYEYLHTTDQSGPYHDRDGLIYGGADNYFTNGIYKNGWNYYLRTIGTPYITSPLYNTNGEIYSLNTRIMAHFLGVRGNIFGYRYRVMASHVKNYGTYSQYQESNNKALLIEVTKQFEKVWGLEFSLSLATDIGNQFGNSFGTMLTIAKRGLITAY